MIYYLELLLGSLKYPTIWNTFWNLNCQPNEPGRPGLAATCQCQWHHLEKQPPAKSRLIPGYPGSRDKPDLWRSDVSRDKSGQGIESCFGICKDKILVLWNPEISLYGITGYVGIQLRWSQGEPGISQFQRFSRELYQVILTYAYSKLLILGPTIWALDSWMLKSRAERFG